MCDNRLRLVRKRYSHARQRFGSQGNCREVDLISQRSSYDCHEVMPGPAAEQDYFITAIGNFVVRGEHFERMKRSGMNNAAISIGNMQTDLEALSVSKLDKTGH